MAFHNATWDDYTRLLAMAGDGPLRLTYDRGYLEVERPSILHEMLSRSAGDMITTYAMHHGINILMTGSATLKLEAADGGCEADESYYITHFDDFPDAGDIDFAIHPPPDLAVEIDLSPPTAAKALVYQRLGVPEIWRWDGNRLRIERRDQTGRYAEVSDTQELPSFPLNRLAEVLAMGYRERAAAVADYRRAPHGR